MKKQTGYEKDDAAPTPQDESFKDSDGHSLNGLTLQPYTIERMWAADAMGLRYGYLTKTAIQQFRRNNTYPGMSGDVAIVIWLCSLEDIEEVRAARRNPSSAEESAVRFAEEHKMANPKQKQFWLAYDVFLKIMDEIHKAYAEPDVPEIEKKTTMTESTTRQVGRVSSQKSIK